MTPQRSQRDGRRAMRAAVAAFLAVCALSYLAVAGNTYFTDLIPNVEVSEPNCHSFIIHVSQASGSSATLALRVEDVDEEDGELDTVYLNGQYLGTLTGTNGQWSTTTFNITSQILYDADNTIQICIDPDGGEANTWVATIDWGQILVDGGSAEDAEITSVSASGDWNAIQVQTQISATNSDPYRLEINLLDSGGDNKDIAVDPFPMTGGTTTTRYNTLSLPNEPTGSETFTIEALLFNDATGVQQNVKTTTWVYASDPPTDIVLSSDHVDENLPAMSFVGRLTATDPDSVSHTFAIIAGDTASFMIAGDELRTSASFDHESVETYSMEIEAEDGDGNTYSKWFTITIDDVNEAPVAVDDYDPVVVEGASVAIEVLANDSDVDDGDVLSVHDATTPGQGTAVIQLDNSILYTPDPGACGSDTFEYTAEDASGATSTTASVVVTIHNVAPTPSNDVASTPEGIPILIGVIANDSDAGGGPITIDAIADPSFGTAALVGDEIRYTPQTRFEGIDRFSYTVRDPCGATASAAVEVRVEHVNHPPTANAGTFYQGLVNEPVELSASFSNDPDLGDVLQYRWDLEDDGSFDTGWLATSSFAAVYPKRFVGRVRVEVRDLYRGLPTGETATATALIRIDSLQSIQALVFEDLDGDAFWSEDEPGLEGIEVEIGGETLRTGLDGRASIELDVGTWAATLTEAARALLESRGFAIVTESATARLGASELIVLELAVSKTSTRLKGIVYTDVNANGELDEEDRIIPGLIVVLDGDKENPDLTDEEGRFSFRDVAFGSHTLLVQEAIEEGEEDPLSLLLPFSFSRAEKPEIHIAWPYDLGPGEGFLRVDVEKGEGGTP